MVTVLAVIFLIAGVIFVLSQTLNITGSNSIDNSRQMDSTAAFFLAESGLERARGIMGSSAASGTLDNSVCSGITTGGLCGTGSFALGTGRSFCYNSASSVPDPCTSGACTACNVRVTGTAGSASRTLNLKINLTSDNGVTGFGGCPTCTPPTPPVTMTLKNTFGVPATAMFNLAWRRVGGTAGQTVEGGNAIAFECTLSNCDNQWHVESGNGNPSVGSMGVSVFNITAGSSTTVSQTLDKNRNYAEVGAWFPGLPNAAVPAIQGSYWKDSSGSGRTVNNNNATPSHGETNSGVASPSVACTTPTNSTNTSQTCTSWCNGADTLVFGVSGRSDTVANAITGVTFDTNNSTSQHFPLAKIAHFPNTDGTTPKATGDIYSEIWKAYNPNYLSSSGGAGATSYPRAVKGTIGAIFIATLAKNGTSMVVSSVIGGKLSVGDIVSGSNSLGNGAGSTSITIAPDNGLTGTYTLLVKSDKDVSNASLTTASTKLMVSGVTAVLTTGATNNGVTISSGPENGNNYTISAATTLNSGAATVITQGSSGAIITVPIGTAPTAGTIVAVYSGTGKFIAGTTVSSPTATTFTVSNAPTSGNEIKDAIICGGICALFNNPSSITSTTQFTVTRTPGTTQWAGGFTCLSGVDNTKVRQVTSSSTTASTWSEMVQ